MSLEYDINKQIHTLEFSAVRHMLADRCLSGEAKAIAEELLPCPDYESALLALSQTRCAYEMSVKLAPPSFYGLCIPADQLGRASLGGALSIKELLSVSAAVRVLRTLVNYRKSLPAEETALDSLFGRLRSFRTIEDAVENAVQDEETLSDNASPELRSIRRKIRQTEESIRSRMNSIAASAATSKFLQEAAVTIRDGRFVVPVKAEHKNSFPGLVHGVSASGATLFIEPATVVEASNDLKILQAKETNEILRILAELSKLCGQDSREIIDGCRAAASLELIFAKVGLGLSMNAFIPEYNDSGIVDIKKARHPLIDQSKVVPIDIRLGADFDALVITGPNTGGKTVALKTIGLFCMMASCGLMIPAGETSRVSWFDMILADIGDEQSIAQSLSTFSSHIKNIVSVLKLANKNSLVLMDELGAGTDPAEGAALAISIIDTLLSRGSRIVATTHYAELKQYALTTPRVVNGNCEFDIATLMPTYRLTIGTPGSSNAFEISRRLGVSESVIADARERMDKRTAELDKVMALLEESRQDAEKAKAEAQSLLRTMEIEKKAFDEKIKSDSAAAEKELERYKSNQLRVYEQARFESERLLKELDKLRKSDRSRPDELARQAKTVIAESLSQIDKKLVAEAAPKWEEDYVLPRPLAVGDEVYIIGIEKNGVVLEVSEKSNNVVVDIGFGKMKTTIDKIRLPDKQKKGSKKEKNSDGHVSYSIVSRADRQVDTSLMLRHLELVQAIPAVEAFLDDCVLAGLKTVTIVHGKGGGVLKKAVHELLRSHPNVESFRLGRYGEGEQGVTVVELK